MTQPPEWRDPETFVAPTFYVAAGTVGVVVVAVVAWLVRRFVG